MIREARKPEPIRISGAGLKWAGVVAIIIVIIVGFAVLYHPPGRGLQVGDAAPNFIITTTTGEVVSLDQFRGSVVLLDFMDTDCGVCKAHTPADLVPLFEQWDGTVVFLSIDVGWVGSPDTVEKIIQFKADTGASWSYALDKQNLDDVYGVTGTPTTYLIDQDGIVAYHETGAGATKDVLSAEINKIIGG